METIIETYVIILSILTKCHEVDFGECEFGEYSKKFGEYFKSGESQKRDFWWVLVLELKKLQKKLWLLTFATFACKWPLLGKNYNLMYVTSY